jgi:YcaO-like protein with predicted kinase domain
MPVGAPAEPASAIQGTPKGYRHGTHRACSPEATWARVAPLMPRLGITRVGILTGLDTIGLPVAMAVRPASLSVAVSQGKGLTPMAARVSAVMEAAETYAGEQRRGLHLLTASAAWMRDRDYPTVPLESLQRAPGVAAPPEPTEVCPWVLGWDLIGQGPIWVPEAVVHTRYRAEEVRPWCHTTTSGLAAGNTRAEAVVHALCELIERDAEVMWQDVCARDHGAALDGRALALETVDDSACRAVCAALDRAETDVVAWDVSTDLPVPVYQVAVAPRPGASWGAIAARGSGCHPVPAIALCRALTEACQSRLSLIAGARDDLWPALYQRNTDPGCADLIRRVARAGGRRAWHAGPAGADHETSEADLAWLLERLVEAGMRHAIAVDLTPDERLPVVRVVVPGLRQLAEDGP